MRAFAILLLLQFAPALYAEKYLFAGFKNNGAEGLYYALSSDGLNWTLLNSGKPVVPTEQTGELMRDPHLSRNPAGGFELVWTWSWNQPAVVGHAHSADLLHWSSHTMLPVMAAQPETQNVWAPEAYWDAQKKQWLIIWSSTVNLKPNTRDHRIWSVTTSDFVTLSEPKVFFDPGFNVIDATILPVDGKFHLIFKDERETPLKKFIHTANGPTLEGPWTAISTPITEAWSEGPSALPVGTEYFLYYDHYRKPQHYAVMRSKDLTHWEDATKALHFPEGFRHGTFLPLSDAEAEKLK